MKKRIITSLFFTLLLSVVFANVSFAAIGLNPDLHPNGAPTISGNLPEEEGIQSVDAQRLALTRKITNLIFGVASIVAIFFVVQNGWSMAASAGSEEKVTQAKKGLTWAAIGLLLIILSYSIIRFVITTSFQVDQGTSSSAADKAALPAVGTDAPFAPTSERGPLGPTTGSGAGSQGSTSNSPATSPGSGEDPLNTMDSFDGGGA